MSARGGTRDGAKRKREGGRRGRTLRIQLLLGRPSYSSSKGIVVLRVVELVLPLALALLVLVLVLLGARGSNSSSRGVLSILLLRGNVPCSERFEDLGKFELASEEEKVDDLGGLYRNEFREKGGSVLARRTRRGRKGGREGEVELARSNETKTFARRRWR